MHIRILLLEYSHACVYTVNWAEILYLLSAELGREYLSFIFCLGYSTIRHFGRKIVNSGRKRLPTSVTPSTGNFYIGKLVYLSVLDAHHGSNYTKPVCMVTFQIGMVTGKQTLFLPPGYCDKPTNRPVISGVNCR